ncbi:hypothetical protein FNV43_RR08387 [Rhamnella rubrinervis]|uniref:TIR domain-containing protein n=1 Tax=Rhamnella rubrinervis TaxID=2594499 RepID=A0A8K0H8N7_9ROSA|nr:hypothetical protein FNV43_RR08387 [Rhamnella rubrinervis]
MKTDPSSSSSSSSASLPAKKFDVFLSFRGEDTRNNFTGHLSLALRKIGLFNIFKDDYALDIGKDIGPELMKAIEDSQYAVVVLSENYATSSWCLKEVAKIVECMGDSGRIRTIFYHVNPFHVRNVVSIDEKKQKESSFWKALKEHAENPNYSKDLERWRKALVTVANQSGHTIEVHTDEAIFIENFVADISSKLGATISTIEGLFGMVQRLKKLDSYVLDYSAANNVCFIGIHGMGGIGKTTLAEAYHMKMSHKFDGSCFLANIREVCEKQANGLVDLQKKLLKDILGGKFQVEHLRNGINLIRSRLRAMKVLIILDDVNNPNQLEALADSHRKKQGSENELDIWFGPGSVIIVTTRNENLLTERYEKSFGSTEPPKEFKELSKEVVKYASNLPLALTILGSLFRPIKKNQWESVLSRLRKCPEKDIVGKLKISYDNLDEVDQCIFLDIACFFRGHHKTSAIKILDSCAFNSEYGISNLIAKSLLSITKYGTNQVEAIAADVHETKEYSFEALSSMKKLRILSITNANRRIFLMGQSLILMIVLGQSFLTTYVVPNLQILYLCGCEKLSEIHPSIKHLKSLIKLDLKRCRSLKELPEEINGLTSLQSLNIVGCSKIEKLPDNFEKLKSLRNLEIKDSGIKHLPSSIFLMENLKSAFCEKEMIKSAVTENIISYSTTGKCFISGWFCSSLYRLDLIDCNLIGPEAFPDYFGKLVGLQYLDLSKNPFSVLPAGIKVLSRLTTLKLEHCKSLRCLEAELLPSSLQVVSVNYCTSLASFLDPLKPCLLSCSAYCLECTELVRRQDGKKTALASLSRFLQATYSGWINFKFGVPQRDNELPSWFINQSPTPSNSIKLHPRGHSVVDAHTFEFSFRNADEYCSSCGPWGVRLVYEEDEEELKEFTSKYNNDQAPHHKDVQSSNSQRTRRSAAANEVIEQMRQRIPILEQTLETVRTQLNVVEATIIQPRPRVFPVPHPWPQ